MHATNAIDGVTLVLATCFTMVSRVRARNFEKPHACLARIAA